MEPPPLSLDYTDWLVYSDWLADYRPDRKGRKIEQWSRRIGTALRKMHYAGVDPKCAIVFYSQRYDRESREWSSGWYLYEAAAKFVFFGNGNLNYERVVDGLCGIGYRMKYVTGLIDPIGSMKEWRWVTPNEAKSILRAQDPQLKLKPKLWGPADVYEPELHRRLIMKYWRCVVRRSSGIPNEVLNEESTGV